MGSCLCHRRQFRDKVQQAYTEKKKKKLYLNSIKAGMYGQLQRRGESRFYLKTQYTLRSRVNLGEAVLLRVFDLGFYRTFWVRVGVSHDVCRC